MSARVAEPRTRHDRRQTRSGDLPSHPSQEGRPILRAGRQDGSDQAHEVLTAPCA